MGALHKRVSKLEADLPANEGSSWLATRKWLGDYLTPEEEAEVAAYEAAQPPYDPTAPVDTRGLSRECREWLGFYGPASEFHVADLERRRGGRG